VRACREASARVEERAVAAKRAPARAAIRGGAELVQTFLLAAVFIAMGLLWLTGFALLVARIGALLRRSSVRAWSTRSQGRC
jgi:threonine/homoserine/homoserine lactone efflux protein